MPLRIAREITVSPFESFIPLTPIDDLPEKILRSLHENRIHFPSLVDKKIFESSEHVNTFTSLSLSFKFHSNFSI